MVAIVFAAFLASAAFEPIGFWFLAPIGLALFFRKLISTRRPIIESLVFGFVLNAIVLYWTGKYVGALPWLFLSSLQALFYLPIGLVQRHFKNIWLSAFVLLIMEEFRARFPFGGFGWTRIAFSQVDSPALPIVALGGVIALSVFSVALAVLLTRLNLKNSILVAALFMAVLMIPDNPRGSGSIQLLAIQGNTPEVGLGFNSRAQAVFNLHVDATREFARGDFDAIVWPENAIDIDPTLYPEVASEITSLVRDFEAPLIAGVVSQSKDGPQNTSILYSKDGDSQSVYVKRGLTPFGEYMPLRSIAEVISPYAKNVFDFIPGDRRVIHKIQGKRIGPIICYEIIDDELVRDMAENSDALIVQTNSATFANTAQSKQQLAITRIRAVEHSRYILSVSTIGISAFIDNNGRVINKTSENKKSSLLGKLLLSNHTTPIDRFF
jgi:apolipoprotein N-acyltransferase